MSYYSFSQWSLPNNVKAAAVPGPGPGSGPLGTTLQHKMLSSTAFHIMTHRGPF